MLNAIGFDLHVTQTPDEHVDKLCDLLGHAYSVVEPGEVVIPKMETLTNDLLLWFCSRSSPLLTSYPQEILQLQSNWIIIRRLWSLEPMVPANLRSWMLYVIVYSIGPSVLSTYHNW